jgi:hypothetical protein
MWKTAAENPCGCTIWEWGFWYFTILRYACAGEPDTRSISKSEMKRLNVLNNRPMMEGISELKQLPPDKIKKARKALKRLDMKIKPKRKRRKKKN